MIAPPRTRVVGLSAPRPFPGPGRATPAAASPISPYWLHGTGTHAVVLAALPRVVYLGGGHGEVLPVLDAGALRLPGGVLVPSVGAGDPVPLAAGLRPGDRVLVAAGRIHLPGRVLECRRTWRPGRVPVGAVPRLGSGAARLPALVRRRAPGVEGLELLVRDVVTPALAGHRGATETAVRALVGLGPGLTPSGDDALCGVLLALRAAGRARAAALLTGAVRAGLDRTTSLSASLLLAAAQGWCLPQMQLLVRTLAAGGELERPTAEVAAVGHSSGADLLTGLTEGLTAASAEPPAPAPHHRASCPVPTRGAPS